MERVQVKRRVTIRSLLVHLSSTVCDHKVTHTLDVPSFLPHISFAIIHLSPQLADHQKSETKGITGSNWPQVGKSTCSNLGGPPNFHGK
jgi:hypothetical protein